MQANPKNLILKIIVKIYFQHNFVALDTEFFVIVIRKAVNSCLFYTENPRYVYSRSSSRSDDAPSPNDQKPSAVDVEPGGG